jgi:hypothetical protein
MCFIHERQRRVDTGDASCDLGATLDEKRAGGPTMIDNPSPNLILYPVFAMVFLTAGVLAYLARSRIGALGRGEVSMGFYKTFDRGEEPESVRRVTRNFNNLFEVPLLFYVVVILTHVTQQVGMWMIAGAWLYTVLRYAHSYVHLTSNDVGTRFRLYMASGLVLLVMWSSLLVQLLRAG